MPELNESSRFCHVNIRGLLAKGFVNMNRQLDKYLDYYINLKHEPHFAVLINGHWGSGKTWYISEYCKDIKKKRLGFYYISLYGFNNTTQIDDELFKQIHPILSNKGVVFASSLTRSLLKATFNFDINSDNKNDVSLAASIPSIDIKKITKKPSDTILIFDDLERTSIPIKELLGYINHFTEHNGCKVIIVANEMEALKSEADYLRMKEKLIGISFNFNSDYKNAYIQFLTSLDSNWLKNFLKNNIDEVYDVYEKSKCTNLRLLRSFLFEFERFYNVLDKSFREESNIILRLYCVYFIFFFETRQNGLGSYDNGLYLTKGDEKLRVSNLKDKYKTAYFVDTILSPDTWSALMNNILHEGCINNDIRNSNYFSNPISPDWVKLWHFQRLTDSEFLALRANVLNQLKNKLFYNVNEVKHVVGLLLELSTHSLIDIDPESIFELGVACIKKYNQTDKYIPTEDPDGVFRNEYWGGLEFYSSKSEFFQRLIHEIELSDNAYRSEQLKKIAKDIFEKMRNEDSLFIPMLSLNNVNVKSYHDVSILNYIPVRDFAHMLLVTGSANRNSIGYAISGRYKNIPYDSDVFNEQYWLEKLIIELKKIITKLKKEQCLTKYNLEYLLKKYLVPAYEYILSTKAQN